MIYDPFQQEAIKHINDGHSLIVSAPTGAGKTVIAEHVINDCLKKNLRAVYTAPIKALSNQKFRDFQKTFKDKIGILTGDVSINPDATILIMTTEIFRNKALEAHSNLEKYSWIIFDEIHYLDDYERGTVWEESLIFLPDHMRLLALSATIPNIKEFADWIASIHKRPIKVVMENKRPVPLHFFYQCQGNIFDNLNKVRRFCFERYPRHYPGRPYKRTHQKPNKVFSLIKHLLQNDRLPCIYFSFSRKRCAYLAEEISGFDFLSSEEKLKIHGLFDRLCQKFALLNEPSALALKPLIEKGIAYHHAGMLPTLKEVVERLFTSKLLKVIFTTETFALGINMPARTVVFDEIRKFYGRFFRSMRTRDFYQMAGRAGRRSIDREGFVYTRINPNYVSFQELTNTIHGKYENVHSRFNASYATVLNLYGKYQENMYAVYPKSFHYFQEKKNIRARALKTLHSKVAVLKEIECIRDNRLTEKGVFASQVYGYELPLSELYSSGMLEGLSESELGILALALVFEPRKGTQNIPLSKKVKKIHAITDHVIRHVHYIEKKYGMKYPSKNFYYQLTPCLEAWMRNEPFSKILQYTDADEGGVIRYFRMCIQILREILETNVPGELKEKARHTVLLINRDIVDAEKQLRVE